ncbi:MAG: response regulator transcription factor [Chitinophagaceae bacterium]|nr:response regulator transcription factor [Chitinophagaceae bacterium]MCO5241241.1 response regulator transcription factor [Chitinophagaceae bacterium]
MKQTDTLYTPPAIAVVDDHLLMRETICQILEAAGFNVELKLPNGRELLANLSLSENVPKLCLLDIQMSVMSGLDTLKKLRELYPGIKVLIYSFTRDERTIRELLECGAEGYLFKGCALEELILKLKGLLVL